MGSANAKHILIVEDSPDLQILLTQLFTDEGYAVSQAYDGAQALDFLRAARELPAVILLDVMMPGMDGIEFRQHQERDPRLSALPVIVMTADSGPKGRAASANAAAFFPKPITDVDSLLKEVARLVK